MVFKKAVKEWMILNQFGRRNLSNYQRSVLALELEEVFTKKAKENQLSGLKQFNTSVSMNSPNLPLANILNLPYLSFP